MNYVFLDTCSWIDFACGKRVDAKFDITNTNIELLEDLKELVKSGRIIFLKNEIIDLEFKDASIDNLILHYNTSCIKTLEKVLRERILIHSNSTETTKILENAINSLSQVKAEFLKKSTRFNEEAKKLFRSCIQINVPEALKQRALEFSINKGHPLFEGNKNNINDYLILYSIQHWIESNDELRSLDETDENHAIYFVTKNVKDFKIDITNGTMDESLKVSQLVTPVKNLHDLLSWIKKKENNWEDFLPYKLTNNSTDVEEKTLEDVVLENQTKLISLKKELLIAYIREHLAKIDVSVKLKYVSQISASKYTEPITGDFPLIRSQNIVNQELIPEDLIRVKKSSSYIISKKGDVLITSFSSKAGEYCFNELDFETYVHSSIYVMRFDQSLVNLGYINYMLKVLDLKHNVAINKFKYHIPTLNISEVRDATIKLPSLENQQNLAKLFFEKEREIVNDILKVKRKTSLVIS